MDARWIKKSSKAYFDFKSNTNIDKEHELIRNYKVTNASVYDGHVFADIYIHGSDCQYMKMVHIDLKI